MARVPTLTDEQRKQVAPVLLDPIEYRKSGLSLNHIIGCPLDCAYCVRHLFSNFGMKQPHLLMPDDEAVELLTTHRFFQRDLTPIQVFNRATDPFLPGVKPHTFAVLRELDRRGLNNHVLVITRWCITPEDCDVLNALSHLRLTVFVTYSGINDPRIEPVDSNIAAESLRVAHERADRYRTVLSWRPLVPGLNDTPEHLEAALALSHHAHAVAFTGLFFRDEIRAYYRSIGLPEPYSETARRKILPEAMEHRVLAAFVGSTGSPLFRKTSCAVAYAHRTSDYNGHYGIRELCDICPAAQLERCAASFRVPEPEQLRALAERIDVGEPFSIGERAVEVDGLDEQRRYYLQHSLGFQVHNPRLPHQHRRHGRAEIGWDQRYDHDDE